MPYTVDDVNRVMDGDWESQTSYGYKYTQDDGSLWTLLKYQDVNDVPTELGVVSLEKEHGGEGQGDEYWVVVKITNGDSVRYFKRLGWYASYCGGELDGPTVEVKPEQRLVTVYE